MGIPDGGSSSALHIRSDTSTETTLELSTKGAYNGTLPSAKISFTQQNGTEIARIKCDTNTGAANMADLTFWTNYGGLYERMRITKTGEVGINVTPSNGQMLAVTGRSGYDDIVQVTAVGTNMGARINLTNTGTGVARINATNNDLALQTGGTSRLHITSNGKVGINETAPDRQLHVKSGANSNDGAFRIESANGNIMDMGTDGTGHFLNCVNADPFRVKFVGTEKLRIDSSGNMTQTSTGFFQIAKGTTGQRPSGVDGMLRFNTTLSQTEEYRDNGWFGISNKTTVTGGTVTTSGGYTIHTFTSSGTLLVTGQAKSGIEYLVVAGGGGGGGTRAGGGGAGGVVVSTNQDLAAGDYTVTIGGGGGAGSGVDSAAAGGPSSLGSLQTCSGGGYGGGQGNPGGDGGSGGGGSDGQNGGSGTSGQGNSGGNSTGSTGGGGGGGKGQAGATPGNYSGGNGGTSLSNSYSGSSVEYGGGGGGGSRDNAARGTGGGGAGNGGKTTGTNATAGSANQGGGGGGGGRHSSGDSAHRNGAAGGSGIVIVRYLT